MNWFEAIDNYCERTDASLVSEPLNFLTNLAFIVAAYFLGRDLKKIPVAARRPGSTTLVGLVFGIGIGSAMFHSFATTWAMMADVIPIAIFLFSYLFCFFRWEAKLSLAGSCTGLFIFILLTAMTASIADRGVSNGSELYFGAWTALFGLGCYMLAKPNAEQRWLTIFGSVMLSVSLFMRAIDMRLCEAWPYGTHFLWHSFNGLTLYFVTKSYLINAGQDQQS